MRLYALQHSLPISHREWRGGFPVSPNITSRRSISQVSRMLWLMRRPDYELAHVTTLSSSISDLIRAAYAHHDNCVALLRALGSEEILDSDLQLSAQLRARHINIQSIMACCAIARIKRIFHELWFLVLRTSSIGSSMRHMILR